MKIRVLSSLYQNAVQRRHGIFIDHRRALLEQAIATHRRR